MLVRVLFYCVTLTFAAACAGARQSGDASSGRDAGVGPGMTQAKVGCVKDSDCDGGEYCDFTISHCVADGGIVFASITAGICRVPGAGSPGSGCKSGEECVSGLECAGSSGTTYATPKEFCTDSAPCDAGTCRALPCPSAPQCPTGCRVVTVPHSCDMACSCVGLVCSDGGLVGSMPASSSDAGWGNHDAVGSVDGGCSQDSQCPPAEYCKFSIALCPSDGGPWVGSIVPGECQVAGMDGRGEACHSGDDCSGDLECVGPQGTTYDNPYLFCTRQQPCAAGTCQALPCPAPPVCGLGCSVVTAPHSCESVCSCPGRSCGDAGVGGT